MNDQDPPYVQPAPASVRPPEQIPPHQELHEPAPEISIHGTNGKQPPPVSNKKPELVHQVSDWSSGAAAYFGWMREAKRENTRCGL
jgi:hypothetical protein